MNALSKGAPLKGDGLPKQLCLKKDRRRRPKEIKYLNYAGLWVIYPDIAEIFRSFDPGGGVYPVEILDTDRKTPLPGGIFILVIGNTKDTPDTGACELRPGIGPIPLIPRYTDNKGAIRFRPEATAGPDLWIEAQPPRTAFSSGPLGDALIQAKRDKRFSFWISAGSFSRRVGVSLPNRPVA